MPLALQHLEPTTRLHSADFDSWQAAQLGSRLGASHRVVKLLSSGGFGHVFLTEHVTRGTVAAAKFSLPGHPLAASMLRQEASVLSSIAHANIVRFCELGSTDAAGAYLLMEYARGIELESWLQQH